MATKRNYSRYFIILQEDEKGYSIDSNKFPTGYSKIERRNTKCKVSYYIQNLKKSNDPYYMLLMCEAKGDKRLVKLGTIDIDDYGRADVSYEYDIDNIANCSIPMDNIKGASIVRLNSGNIHGILTGFVSGSKMDDWKSYAMVKTDDDRNSDTREEPNEINYDKGIDNEVNTKEENESEHNIFAEYEKNIESIKSENNSRIDEEESELEEDEEKYEDIDENDIEDDSRQEIEDEKEFDIEDIDEDTRKCCCKKEKKEHSKKEKKNKEKENKKEEKKKEKKCNDTIHKFLKDTLKGLKEVQGVCPEVKNSKWYIINEEDLKKMKPDVDFDKYTMLYYPMLSYYSYIKNYGHYLIGCKFDDDNKISYLIYAIPGTKSLLDQPFGGETGFVTWISRNANKNDGISVGYWAMFYDFRNRKIVYPVKK